ncbi:MAG: hypothetical protein ACOC3V_04755 [bacterium]
MNDLEKRMYFFVPYNISPIQQAIQAGHAAIEYSRKYKDSELFIDFADNWKTWIILNGGTTNNNINRGLLEIAHLSPFRCGEIDHSLFYEPDLNDALTAICFIADERVFNYEDYPDIYSFSKNIIDTNEWFELRNGKQDYGFIKQVIPSVYKDWELSLGGSKNVFLRNILRNKKLA